MPVSGVAEERRSSGDCCACNVLVILFFERFTSLYGGVYVFTVCKLGLYMTMRGDDMPAVCEACAGGLTER